MTQKLLPFPTAMLGGFVKKAALYLPPEHKNAILAAANSKEKPNKLLEKTKIIVISLLAAKQHTDDNEFLIDLKEGFSTLTLTIPEYYLFDGLLGAKHGMLLEFAKKGISPERLKVIRSNLPKPALFN